MSEVLVPVLAHKRLRAWPKHVKGGKVAHLSLTEALEREFDTDAHFAAYSLPALERRLSVDALRDAAARKQLGAPIPMVCFVADVDCAGAHRGELGAVDEWWVEEQAKLERLLTAHPQGYVYRTRGGYRIVYRLDPVQELGDAAAAEGWSLRYLAWAAYLERAFGIQADRACKDWTRLFRLPHARREDAPHPERRETLGKPREIGAWRCDPTPEDLAAARKGHKQKARRAKASADDRPAPTQLAGEGVLHRLFQDRGWVGPSESPGAWRAICPNHVAHTSGQDFDGSTVLFAPAPGEAFGWVYCHHAHCEGRKLRDVLTAFTEAEIAQAKEQCGIVPVHLDKFDPPPAAPDAGSGPEVLVPGAHDTETGTIEVGTHAFAEAALAAIPEADLYRMDSVVGRLEGEPGGRRFVSLGEAGARMLTDRHARLVRRRYDKKQQESITSFIPCSWDLATLVLEAAATSPRVRDLRSMSRYPVYLPDLTLAEPGWNPTAHHFYDASPALGNLSPRPETALDVLLDLVVDWPFADQASRQNALGMMLTALLRPAIDGPIPFHIVMASLERTGKGKLIDTTLGYAIQGRPVELIQLPPDESEREKRITSLLLRGPPVVHFDNLPTGLALDSPALASLATAHPTWGGRVLGVSRTPQLPNQTLWVLSGNNPSASGEVVKRCVPIFLQPRDEHPELRDDFVHPDCYAYALSRRREILEALLGLVEAWKAAGTPGCPVRMGGFERWAHAVGGCLHLAGATEWMANYTRWLTTADDTQVDAGVLVEAWAQKHENGIVTAHELLALIHATGAFRWVLAKPTPEGQAIAFGRRVLSALVNRPVRGWIVRKTQSGSSATYRLERMGS